MKHVCTLAIIFSLFAAKICGQTLEDIENAIVKKSRIKTKTQLDFRYSAGAVSKIGIKSSITKYSNSGKILTKDYLDPKGLVVNWEKYSYDQKGNRIFFEQKTSNGIYRKESLYNINNFTIQDSGFNGAEHFMNTFQYINNLKLKEVVNSSNDIITEKLLYEYSPNTTWVSVFRQGNVLASKLRIVSDSKGNTIEETVFSTKNQELESKKYMYDASGNMIEETKTREGKFFYMLTYCYNSAGKLISVSEQSPTLKKFVKKMYIFDASGNLVQYKWRRNGDEVFNAKTYTHNAAGIIQSEHTFYPQSKFELLSKFEYEFY